MFLLTWGHCSIILLLQLPLGVSRGLYRAPEGAGGFDGGANGQWSQVISFSISSSPSTQQQDRWGAGEIFSTSPQSDRVWKDNVSRKEVISQSERLESRGGSNTPAGREVRRKTLIRRTQTADQRGPNTSSFPLMDKCFSWMKIEMCHWSESSKTDVSRHFDNNSSMSFCRMMKKFQFDRC